MPVAPCQSLSVAYRGSVSGLLAACQDLPVACQDLSVACRGLAVADRWLVRSVLLTVARFSRSFGLSGPVSGPSGAFQDLSGSGSGVSVACQVSFADSCMVFNVIWPLRACRWPVRAWFSRSFGLSGPVSGLSGPGNGLSVACQVSFADSCTVFEGFCGRSARWSENWNPLGAKRHCQIFL